VSDVKNAIGQVAGRRKTEGKTMKDILLPELLKINRDIKNYMEKADGAHVEAQEHNIFAVIQKVLELARIGRKEGLFAVEGALMEIDMEEHPEYVFLPEITELVVDGFAPERIQDICTMKYFSSDFSDFSNASVQDAAGYAALNFLICQEGMLAVQRGESPYTIERLLLSMLPSSVADAYRGYKEKLEEEKSRTPASYDNSIVEKYYTGGLDAGTDSPEGLAIAVCDAIIREFTDEQVQRLLRDLDNTDVALMMRGISGEGRKKIFTNMSDLLATMVAADMDCMGEVSLRDVYAATEKILSVIEKFIKRGDICCEEENLIETATKFIRAQAAKKPDPDELREAGLELVMVLEEYRQQRHFVFQPIRAGENLS
jgi:hypothetical protein